MNKRTLSAIDLEPVSLSNRNSERQSFSGSGGAETVFTLSSDITLSSTQSSGPKTGDPKYTNGGTGKDAAGKGDGTGPGNGAGQGKSKSSPPPIYDTIVVGQDSNGVPLYWGDANEDGIYTQGTDALLTLDALGKLSDSAGQVNYTLKDYTVVFQAINASNPALDLTGFDALDKITIDFKTLPWMGLNDGTFNAAIAGPPTSADSNPGISWSISRCFGTPIAGFSSVSLTISRLTNKLQYTYYWQGTSPSAPRDLAIGLVSGVAVNAIFPDGL